MGHLKGFQDYQIHLNNPDAYQVKLVNHCDFMVISFPKSGRTWLRYLLSQYWSLLFNTDVDDDFSLTKKEYDSPQVFPKVLFTHNYMDYLQSSVFEPSFLLDLDKLSYRSPLFLFRHPLDVAVSYFYHKKYREKVFTGSLSEFLRSPLYGAERVCHFNHRLLDAHEKCSCAYLFSYENLINDPQKYLKALLSFWGVAINSKKLSKAIRVASFKNMKKKERMGIGVSARLKLPDGRGLDSKSCKVRRGVVGGYINEIAYDDKQFIENTIIYQTLIVRLKAYSLV